MTAFDRQMGGVTLRLELTDWDDLDCGEPALYERRIRLTPDELAEFSKKEIVETNVAQASMTLLHERQR